VLNNIIDAVWNCLRLDSDAFCSLGIENLNITTTSRLLLIIHGKEVVDASRHHASRPKQRHQIEVIIGITAGLAEHFLCWRLLKIRNHLIR